MSSVDSVAPMRMMDLLDAACDVAPDRHALVFPDARSSYADLREGALAKARSLVALGIRPKDRVGILMHNSSDYLELLFGATMAGAIPVPINARFRQRELAYSVRDAGLSAVVISDAAAEHADYVARLHGAVQGLEEADDPSTLRLAAFPHLRVVACLDARADHGGMLDGDAFLAAGKTTPVDRVLERMAAVAPDDTAMMIYTSGTTADPKGCPLGHSGLLRTADQVRRRIEIADGEVMWNPLPMFHLSSTLKMLAVFGAVGTFASMRHFEPGTAIDQIIAERPTLVFTSFPTVSVRLIEHPRWKDVDVSRVRVMLNGGPAGIRRRLQDAFPEAAQISAYGLTEATGVVGYNDLSDDFETRLEVGVRPFDQVEVRIVEPESLAELPAGVDGEIWIRGYSVFQGYWNDPVKQAETVTSDGWLRTGDLGSVDDRGRIRYSGRLKDMLKVGGENVAAIEIESHLATHPAVKLTAVIGVPDAEYSEVPVAFVELREGAAATAEELIEHCRTAIAAYRPLCNRVKSQLTPGWSVVCQ